MTKRPSPFEPSICRQSKIHFNNFENDLIAQKEMEGRTLKKLVDGSKKFHSIILNGGDPFLNENGVTMRNSNFLQTSVTNYFTVNGKKLNENDRVMITPFEAHSRCFFCETKTTSVYQCTQCLEVYCSACSFVNYESSEDRRICLSCS